jgi:ribosomal-protein-alanine N-acetyltransferase
MSSVTLRLPRLEDYPAWRALRDASAAYLRKVEPEWAAPMDRERFAREVEATEKAAREGRGASLLICRPNGQLVGGITLGPIIDGAAMLGTWIGAPFVNHGYAVRAVDAVLHIAFDVLKLNVVAASVLPDNDPSTRILEYFGFEFDPSRNLVMTVGGEPRAHCVYVVRRHEWDISPSQQSRGRVPRHEGSRDADAEQGPERRDACG